MGRRQCASSNVYHVMSRGSGKQLIFEDNSDRRRYAELMRSSFPEGGGVLLLAWCLMDNHVHLLVSGELPRISASMRHLNASYAMYFNKRHERVGHLFQGRYKSVPVESDAQLLAVIRYIHQNPWKAGYTDGCDYPWSSYSDFLTGENRNVMADDLLCLFGGIGGFVDFHARLEKEQDSDYGDGCERRGRKVMSASEALTVARKALDGMEPGGGV